MKSISLFNEKIPAFIIGRVVTILFIICVFNGILFVIGAMRGFADQTLLVILNFSTITGALLLVSSFIGMVFYVGITIFKKEIRYLGRIGLFFLLMVLGGAISTTAYLLIIMSEGNAL